MHRRINLEEFRIAFIFLCFSLIWVNALKLCQKATAKNSILKRATILKCWQNSTAGLIFKPNAFIKGWSAFHKISGTTIQRILEVLPTLSISSLSFSSNFLRYSPPAHRVKR
jgi:hypothetical protein